VDLAAQTLTLPTAAHRIPGGQLASMSLLEGVDELAHLQQETAIAN